MDKFKKEMNAVNLVFENSKRFYISNNGDEVVVIEISSNKVVHKLGTFKEYAEMMTKYAEIPCEFSLK